MLKNLFHQTRSAENPAVPLTWAAAITAMTGGTVSATGKIVSVASAMRVSTVLACMRVLAETISSLELCVFERAGKGKRRAETHPLYSVLHDLGNAEMTALEVRENLQGHLAGWGKAFAEIEYNTSGDIIGLWPLRPDRVMPQRDESGKLHFVITLPNQERRGLPAWRVFRIRGFSLEQLEGLSVVMDGREAIGLALATEEFGARFFANGTQLSGVLKSPKALTEKGASKLKDSWEAAHSGLDQAHRVAVLEEGIEWQQIGIAPENAQFLETRKFQRNEIATLFRIPPHMVGDLERATFTNIEQQSLEFVTYTLHPWLVRWEQAIYRDLLKPNEREALFVRHLRDPLLMSDVAARGAYYSMMRQNGAMNADEIREREGYNPIPDGSGQEYLANGTLTAVGEKAKEKEKEKDPAAEKPQFGKPQAKPGTDETDDEDEADE